MMQGMSSPGSTGVGGRILLTETATLVRYDFTILLPLRDGNLQPVRWEFPTLKQHLAMMVQQQCWL